MLFDTLQTIIKEKKMAKKMFGAVMLCIITVSVLTGCVTVKSIDRLNPVGGNYQDIKVPNKDFESKGLVLAEYVSEGDGAGSEEGEVYTYYKLLAEAKKLGADTIVNVVIEAAQEAQTEKLFGFKMKQGITKKTWFGAATAIKYTDTIKVTGEKSVIVLGADGKQLISEKAVEEIVPLAEDANSSSGGFLGGNTSSGKKWWNPFTWFKK
jgi:hypothetical protein